MTGSDLISVLEENLKIICCFETYTWYQEAL